VSTINLELLKAHRQRTFQLSRASRVTTPGQALKFVNRRGFVFFWPIKGVDLPSLWSAVAGNRPVAENHDDPGHISWRWKDDALGRKIWYYAKILRHKATLISIELVPYFYALSDNFGAPEEDYLTAYEEGRLTLSSKHVFEALLHQGPLNSIDLRRASKLGNARDSDFNHALEYLQSDFKILPVGIAEAGSWRYSFIYDVVPRHFPELPAKSRLLSERESRKKLIEVYLESVGAAQERDVVKLFGWGSELTRRSMRLLIQSGFLSNGLYPGKEGEWISLPELVKD